MGKPVPGWDVQLLDEEEQPVGQGERGEICLRARSHPHYPLGYWRNDQASVDTFGGDSRFGSWGQEVYLCHDEDELRARLARLRDERWFRGQGALVQSLVAPTGRDLRVVVAAGCVVGAIERRALPGEWRSNVSLGAVRQRVEAPLPAQSLVIRAVTALGLDLAGVDIVTGPAGRMIVLEINGAVDFTAAYGDDVFAAAAGALLARAAVRLNTRSSSPPCSA